MGAFDYFSCKRQCKSCGKNSLISIQTKIQRDPQMKDLVVATELSLTEEIMGWGYLCYKLPDEKNTFMLADPWECKHCGNTDWVIVEVKDSVLSEIREVELSEIMIRRINYISEEVGAHGWYVEEGVVEPEV
jgi:hypothetical protein